MSKIFINIIYTIFAFLMLLYILLFIFQRKLLYFPTNSNDSLVKEILKEYPKSLITIKLKKDITLKGYFIEKSDKAVLYFGGNAENIEYFINNNNSFFDKISLASFYYRGYGLSTGKINQKNLFKDALRIYDYLIKEKNIKEIVVMGRSLGTGVATYLAYKRKVTKVILISPYDSILKIALEKFPFISKFMIKDRYESEKYANKINYPLLAIYSKSDMVVTSKHSKALIKKWRGNTKIIELDRESHSSITNNKMVWKEIYKFIEK